MSKKKVDEIIEAVNENESVEVTEEMVDELTEKAEALAVLHERNVLITLIMLTAKKIRVIEEGQKNKTVKKNNYHYGYLKSANEFLYSCRVLLNMITDHETMDMLEKNIADAIEEEINGGKNDGQQPSE